MKRSLLWHGEIGADLRTDMPTAGVRRDILANLMESVCHEWELPEDFMTFGHFLRVIKDLDFTSSPGYPYRLAYPTNAAFFKYKDGEFTDISRLQEVWELVKLQIRAKKSDPVFLFVKQEPHKISKKGRKRLISSVSIIDQLIDQMLFSVQNGLIYDDAALGPIKAGWSIMNGGWKILPLEGISLDKTAWDWTVKPWLLDICLEFRRLTLKSDPGGLWYSLASWRYGELFMKPRFVLPNGEIRLQSWPGVMKSGCVNTIIDNSLMQQILHLRICLEMGIDPGWIWSLGDDTRQSVPEDLDEYLARISQFSIVKEWTRNCEFAGFRVEKGRIEPLYKGKHAYLLLHCAPNIQEDVARSYSLLYHRSSDKKRVQRILSHLGTPLNDVLLDSVWNG